MNISTLFQAATGQAPASAAATNSEMARLDAQLELAAKKAALAGMQRAAAAQGAEAPPAIAGADVTPARSSGVHVVYEQDGKTIVLDNPSSQQLAALGGFTTQTPQIEGWALVAITGMVVGAIILVAALFLKHLRTRQTGLIAGNDARAEARMARIENAIESVAVEVERISEGQRFTSRMLSEGAAHPINNVPDRVESVLSTRGER